MNHLLTEATAVGIATSILGTILSYLSMAYGQKSFNVKFDNWTSIIISEFLTGFILHLLAEYFGVNKWYCKYGNACRK
jgi:hypothetical protein